MKKLFLTTALVLAAATSAHAVEAPSLGDRIKQNWDQNVDRSSWNAPVKHDPAFPTANSGAVNDQAANGAAPQGKAPAGHKGKHHHHDAAKKADAAATTKATPETKAEKHAAHKAKVAKMTPEEKAKMKADRKAKWDAMTPEQKAAWKAKHSAKKAPVAQTTTATPAAAQ